ncbi:hypothetical protein GIB67_005333 [Kingdonia uniflora]|uniref:F-box domain-containing protein n=1 Tax=Kingdonia uniflora TaxID=39325 RepID=A0A7J7ND33_9MAGN|nr:hypothetical protein GIB67_005333 [Kingdonia uniflora]
MVPRHQNSSPTVLDNFDRIPDDLILIIFNSLSDIKTLTHCRLVSKRFNSLVSRVENLLVRVDSVILNETGDNDDWFLLNLIKTILHSLQDLVSRKRLFSTPPQDTSSSPSEILRGFEKMRTLEIELPAGDLRLGKGTVIRWRAQFGKTLKSCVIFAVQEISTVEEREINGRDEEETDALKLRVVWTISALIAASARHYLLKDVIRKHKEMESLVLRDKDGEGVVVMGKNDLSQFREANGDANQDRGEGEGHISKVGWKTRTTVPAVRMRMRHEPQLDIGGRVWLKGATLVVIRPAEQMETTKAEVEEQKHDMGLTLGAFEGLFGEAAVALVKKPSYLLEMNSF